MGCPPELAAHSALQRCSQSPISYQSLHMAHTERAASQHDASESIRPSSVLASRRPTIPRAPFTQGQSRPKRRGHARNLASHQASYCPSLNSRTRPDGGLSMVREALPHPSTTPGSACPVSGSPRPPRLTPLSKCRAVPPYAVPHALLASSPPSSFELRERGGIVIHRGKSVRGTCCVRFGFRVGPSSSQKIGRYVHAGCVLLALVVRAAPVSPFLVPSTRPRYRCDSRDRGPGRGMVSTPQTYICTRRSGDFVPVMIPHCQSARK
ncbi:hypothetical protein BD310DRAFT_923270 [Dichomitus squalens]|uniref:Uncharacterized protein n=1 Tax=Dichomitus squalens TaxID=114155 RepID=A0A4Q9PZS5_9APHY|nr:hypothetical protein BD310DRAFT_923270 [Dichomitus squalens]